MSLTFAIDIIRTFFAIIDKAIYWLLETLISLFNTLASVQLFDNDVIKTFASRLFIFLSIIMIFKVSFSIIQYIINPDTFTDNEKGMSKTIQNVLISLVTLVLIEPIFSFAYDVQRKIVNENIIPNIILGVGNVDKEKQENVNSAIPFLVLNAFLTPNVEVSGIEYNREKGVYVADGIDMYQMMENGEVQYADGTKKVTYSKGDYNPTFGERMRNLATAKFEVSKYNNAMQNYRYWDLLDMVDEKASNNETYIFEYKILINTIVGAFMVIMYLNFCMDLAIRAAKLGFLELIAPIPIISMIDPKSSKSGMMSKWVKQCLTTFLGLFIRIAAVSFVIYIIYIIMDPNFFKNVSSGGSDIFVQLVIIFGALMFARELPKLITDLTGIDLSGNFNLNPIRRFEEKALGGKRITSAASGLVTGAVGGLASGAMNGRGFGRVTGAVGGLLGGGLRGGATGLTGGQGIRQTRDAVVRNRHALETARANGSTFGGRIAQRAEHAFGVDTELDRLNRQQFDLSQEDDRYATEDADLSRQIAAIDEAQADGRREIANNQKLIDIEKGMHDRAENKIKGDEAGALSTEYKNRLENISQLRAQRDAMVTTAQDYQNKISEATARANNTRLSMVERRRASAIAASNQTLLNNLNNDINNMSNQITNSDVALHDWLEGHDDANGNHIRGAIEEYIDERNTYRDAAMDGMVSNYNSLADSLHFGEERGRTAHDRHGFTGGLSGRNTEIQNGFYNDDREKEGLENRKRQIAEQRRELGERKRRLEEDKRRAQANADAVNHTGGNNH